MSSILKSCLHIIIYSPFPRYSGGRENWLFNILLQLDKQRIPIKVYSYKSNRHLFYRLDNLSYSEIIPIPTLRYFDKLFLISNILTLRSLYIFDSMFVFPMMAANILKKNLGKKDIILAMNPGIEVLPALHLINSGYKFKLICSVRGKVALEQSNKLPILKKYFYRLESRTLKEANAVIANGFDTQTYLKSINIDSQVLPNGVDINRFSNPNLLDPNLDLVRDWHKQGLKIITSLASLRPIKGIDDFLQGINYLKKNYGPEFRAILIGKGDQGPYRKLAAQLGISKETIFLGEQTNIPGFLHYTDVLVCLSGGSGMSMALLEGMAASKAIIAWDTQVYSQLIKNGETGLLISQGDYPAIGMAIKQLIEHPQFAAKLGEKARNVVTKFDWDKISDQLIDIIYS